jgi:hypothetical protein
MQRGQLIKRSGSWYVRYYGAKGCRRALRLGHVSMYPTRESVEPLWQEVMTAVNKYPGKSLGRFVEEYYLPHVRQHKRPSTCSGYAKIWSSIRPGCELLPLREVRTFNIQHLLDRIAIEKPLAKRTLQHFKHFLGGVFRFALQQGLYEGANPATSASIPAPESLLRLTPTICKR